MTIQEIFDKNNVQYTIISKEKGKQIIHLTKTDLMLYIKSEQGSTFKMSMRDFETLDSAKGMVLWLIDASLKRNYYIKFMNKTNWLSASFANCTKSEIFLGKQVLNNRREQKQILQDLIK